MMEERESLGMLLLKKAYGRWWMLLLEGICLVALCAVTLLMPELTLPFVVMLLGIYRGAMGLLYIVISVVNRLRFGSDGGFSIGRGIVDVLIGVLFLAMPGVIISFFSMIVGFWSIIVGVVLVAVGFRTRGGWKVAMVILGLTLTVFGLYAFWNLANFAAVFVMVLGVVFGVVGVFMIVRSFSMRKTLKALEKADDGFTDYTVED